MTILDRFQMGDQTSNGAGALNPAMIIAATINAGGNIDLPLVKDGAVVEHAGVEYVICGDGDIVQQRYRVDRYGAPGGGSTRDDGDGIRRLAPEPLDMVLLACGLTHLLGRHTPPLFRLAKDSGFVSPRLACAGPAFDRRRIRLLHDAFAIHLLAYEERLV